ncbi:hypothetical protein [Sciscionella marina]|uniref:hypothetical protein n=1 Tax=Sciscionella marina TaxID=508770 RepID=UPI00036A8820|nr:hypothetical protein [Sciscionella marina]
MTNTRTRHLGRRTRKAVLVVHLVSVGTWIGLDVAMAILIGTAAITDDRRTAGISYQALSLFAVWPLLIAGVVCLLSGAVLGLGSKFGLLRYWWVAVKLVLNILLSALVLIALRPAVEIAEATGRELLDGSRRSAPVGDLLYPPIVSPIALLVAVVLAVYKPWGRIQRRSRERQAGVR